MRLNKKKHSIGLLIFSFVTIHTLFSCAYLAKEKRQGGAVVERNKETRPTWVDSPTNQLIYTAQETRFHFAVLKALDLPIAVKKSQTSAIDASFALWKPIFDNQVAEIKEIKGLLTASKISSELSEVINQFSHKVHAEISQIEDIYFERIKIENPAVDPELQGVTEYFDVHTLVRLNQVDKFKFSSDLATSLQSAKSKQLRKAGKDLFKRLKKIQNDTPKKSRTKAVK